MDNDLATYYLIAFEQYFLSSLKHLGADFGAILQNAIDLNDAKIKPFPHLTDEFGKKADVSPPRYVPIISSDMTIGKIIGRFYDGDAVGIDTTPAHIPPQSVACIVSNSRIYDLSLINAAEFIKDVEGFIRQGRDYNPIQGVINPVFLNDTNLSYPLHIVKNGAFLPEQASKIDRLGDGTAFMMPKEHQCAHSASLILG